MVFDEAFDLQRGQVDEGVIARCGQLLHACTFPVPSLNLPNMAGAASCCTPL